MRYIKILAVSVLVICSVAATGKKNKEALLPADVLQAKTVVVVIDPEAGIAVDAPNANRIAREDVEKALMNWGRFNLEMEGSNADLIITVRKGDGKMAQPTIGGVPINNRPVIFEPSDSGGRIGVHSGTPPESGDPTDSQSPNPHPQVGVGQGQDTFVVYRGKRDNPLDYPFAWRYSAKDALRSPGVPAVDAFRELVVESEKQQRAKP
jgi:hypothetical protein